MRLSSSTTRICGALSSGAAAAMGLDRRWQGHDPPPLPPSLSGTGEDAMIEETLGRSSALTMASRKRRTARFRARPRRLQRRGEAHRLRRREPLGERAALVGGKQQPLAAVRAAGALHDIALVDQLLQHAAQALLGDVEDVEQIGDAQARMAIDEMQHAVMGAAEIEIGEDGVGIAGEIAIGEEQQLGEFEQLRLRRSAALRAAPPLPRRLVSALTAPVRGSFRSVMLTYFSRSVMSAMLT